MQKKRKRINNTIDLILLILFMILGIYFLIEAFIGGIIPLMYIMIVAAVLLMTAIGLFLTFKSRNSLLRMSRKILLGAMCLVLIFGAAFQEKLRGAFLNVDNGSTSTYLMYVMTLRDSSFDKLDDLAVLGYENQTNDLLTFSLEEIKSLNLSEKKYESMEEGLSALDRHKVDAVLISAFDKSMKEAQDEGYFDQYKIIHTIKMTVSNETESANIDLTQQPFVIYVSGLDDMGEPTISGCSDVNMLLMIDPLNHHAQIISINRDTYVPNPEYKEYPDKLTHLGWIGPQKTADTLEKVFGIEIDYFAKVTFESLIQIIDTMGGIDVDVQLDFCEQDENRSFANEDLICLNKGIQHLNGSQALAYARHRKTEGWEVKGREQAQRDIIKAIVERLLSFDGAAKAGDMVNVAARYVSTNIPMDNAKAFLNNAIQSGASWSFESITIDSGLEAPFPCVTGGGLDRSAVLLQESDIQMVHDQYTAMFEDINMNDFAFDLNEFERYMNTFKLNDKVVTYEHYDETILNYFPEYYRDRFE